MDSWSKSVDLPAPGRAVKILTLSLISPPPTALSNSSKFDFILSDSFIFILFSFFATFSSTITFAAVALIKNMFYDKDILDFLYELFADMTYEKLQILKEKTVMQGIDTIYKDKKISEWMLEIIEMIKEDYKYVRPLEELLKKDQTPKDIYESLYKQDSKNAIYQYSANKFIKEN